MSLILEEIMGIASQVLLMRYMAVASTTLLFYEYAISFGEEVDIIWPSQLSVTKIIFLLNRYPPFATAATATFIIVTDSDFLVCDFPSFFFFLNRVVAALQTCFHGWRSLNTGGIYISRSDVILALIRALEHHSLYGLCALYYSLLRSVWDRLCYNSLSHLVFTITYTHFPHRLRIVSPK